MLPPLANWVNFQNNIKWCFIFPTGCEREKNHSAPDTVTKKVKYYKLQRERKALQARKLKSEFWPQIQNFYNHR